jgi:hypothetical protein
MARKNRIKPYRSTNRWIEIDGEVKLLIEWCRIYEISAPLVIDRLSRGWDDELAITTPARQYKKRGSSNDQAP